MKKKILDSKVVKDTSVRITEETLTDGSVQYKVGLAGHNSELICGIAWEGIKFNPRVVMELTCESQKTAERLVKQMVASDMRTLGAALPYEGESS